MGDLRGWINEGAGRWVVIGGAAALIVAAVVAAVWVLPGGGTRGRAEAIRGRGREVRYVCQNCAKAGKTRVAFDEKFPIACPHCGQRKTVPGFTCVQCRQIIPVQRKSYFVCPECGRVYDNRIPGPAQRPGQ